MAELRVRLSNTSDKLEIFLPSGGSILTDADKVGKVLVHLLQAQSVAVGDNKIGTASSPTQQLVDEWLRKNSVKRLTESGRQQKEEVTLEELGLVEGDEEC